ncbi:DegV family EDD domain-containing protein [Paenibacillus sp. PR3]|uniref:DegV family EDD domain-containing protein n=1 Tax=Paenibacillus terricola TaxID=2763503 RepID=A0ABR8MZ61_9BACL|nr:DegV family protein [Paenibacillus terricola]MBD3920362.1 DegV family EDD domain-containing protein [Paenibacillus terricola]
MHMLNHLTLHRMILAGANEIIAREQELNAINVFPVPDGDTGSNLAHLMRMILRETKPSDASAEVLDKVRRACLRGSRGNSGMIFSQFIISMCSYMSARLELQRPQFIEMCAQSADASRRSVQDPREGTVLSVMNDWVEVLRAAVPLTESIPDLLRRSFAGVCVSLENTKHQMEVLRKNNVVDAGAKGFVHFLQGFISSLSNDTLVIDQYVDQDTQPAVQPSADADSSSHNLVDLEYRYCVEFMLDIRTDLKEIKNRIAAMGNSIVAVGDGNQGKIHIHTDVPERVAEAIQDHGWIVYQKVEDMKRQQDMIYNRQSSIALVIDSACDIPESWLDDYQIHRVPLHLQFERSTYLDKVTLQLGTFYDKLERTEELPTTSQPAQETIVLLYERLLTHYQHIISIHLSKPLSGTYDTCRQAAERVDSTRIHVIDSRTLSGAYGLIVHRAAEAVKAGKPIDQVLELLKSSIPRSEILVSVPTLKHMIRGGRVSPLQGKIASWLDMKPIVSVNHAGQSILYGKTFYRRSNLSKMLRMVARIHRRNPIQSYVILHAGAEADSEYCSEEMMRITGRRPQYITSVSPVIGLHAGKGAVSVAMMLSNDNTRRNA